MKKFTSILVLLVLVLNLFLNVSVFAASEEIELESVNNEIEQLTSEVSELKSEYDKLTEGYTLVYGEVISTTPDFIVYGEGVGSETFLSSTKYFIIQDPESGTNASGVYKGYHKYLGKTILSSGKSAFTMGKAPDSQSVSVLKKQLDEKEKRLEQLNERKSQLIDIIDGNNKGIQIIYYNGDKFIGDFTVDNGVPSGNGLVLFSDYLGFRGSIINGKPDGYGWCTDSKGTDLFTAVYTNGKPLGSLKRAKGDIIMQINNPELLVYGEKTFFEKDNLEAKPIVVNQRTLVPIRKISEILRGAVKWIDEQQKVVIQIYHKTIELTIDSEYAKVNGKDVKLDVPAQIINSKTMIPLRFVTEHLGVKDFKWDEENQLISMNYSQNWKDHEEWYLENLGDKYKFTNIGHAVSFLYPKSWGKPEFDKYSSNIYIPINEKTDLKYSSDIHLKYFDKNSASGINMDVIKDYLPTDNDKVIEVKFNNNDILYSVVYWPEYRTNNYVISIFTKTGVAFKFELPLTMFTTEEADKYFKEFVDLISTIKCSAAG